MQEDLYLLLLSSIEAMKLTEEEIIGYLGKCKVKAWSAIHGEHEIDLDEFLEKFRPDMYEKYKLLIEGK